MKKILLFGLIALLAATTATSIHAQRKKVVYKAGSGGRFVNNATSTKVVGSGAITTRTKSLATFHNVYICAVPSTVRIIAGTEWSVTLTGHENLLPLIKLKSENDKLSISMPNDTIIEPTIQLVITLPESQSLASLSLVGGVRAIVECPLAEASFTASITGSGVINTPHVQTGQYKALVTGSGRISASGRVNEFSVSVSGSGGAATSFTQTNQYTASLSGSGNISADGQADQVSVKVAGSGEITTSFTQTGQYTASVSGSGIISASGQTDKVSASVAGSGGVKLGELQAKQAVATISGSGYIRLFATESITGTIVGSGQLRYKGNPPAVNCSVSGSGKATPMQ